jgi:chromate transporter
MGALVFAAALLGVSELILLLAGGVIGACWLAGFPGRGSPGTALGVLPAGILALGAQPGDGGASLPTLGALGLFFLKIGAVLYGSGYVLIAFLQGGLVERYGWLTRAQLVDAVAAGQFTPGPVLSTATFVGYLVLGPAGAVVATVAIFLPSFVFVALTARHVHRLRKTPWLAAFLDSVNVAALALMAAVTLQLARSTLTGTTA